MEKITCELLEKLGLWKCSDCCGSCHSEWYEGYGSGWDEEVVDGEKITTELCCATYEFGQNEKLRDVIERVKRHITQGE